MDHETFLIFGMKLGKNISKKRVKTVLSGKLSISFGEFLNDLFGPFFRNLFHFFENKTLQNYFYETRSFEDTFEDNFEEKKC